jgi:nitroreductase
MSNIVLDTIAERRSIRAYTEQRLDRAEIEALLTAATQSPSANNAQPWHFTVVQDKAIYAEINAEASEAFGHDLGDIFYDAPTTIFISADPTNRWNHIDSGVAVENIAIAAQGLGLGSVIIGLAAHAFESPNGRHLDDLLKFPTGYKFVIAIAVGHPAVKKDAHIVNPDLITHL